MRSTDEFTLGALAEAIRSIHKELAAQAGKAVNVSLTLRNWLIGLYIFEYELNSLLKKSLLTRPFKNSKCKEQKKFKVAAYLDIRKTLNF